MTMEESDEESPMTMEFQARPRRNAYLRNLDWNLLYLFITIIEGDLPPPAKLALSQPVSA